ncbi:MAG: phosphoribosylglycinamide formyltransferase [Gemmatimonadetes bacterium]|nr:phosphoribosylglycinamide formyltransferase [Gemmatimonadota bacterium]
MSPAARVAVFASGGGTNLEALFEALDTHPAAEIVLVASDREGAFALERAARRGVATAIVAHGDGPSIIELLETHAIGWVVLAGYLRIVPPEVVRRYRGRMLNIHPALLPKFGGAGMYGERVHAAVLAAGETESGVTVHLVDEVYDHGPIVAQRKVTVQSGDTPERLAARVLEVEHELLPEVVIAAAEGRIRTKDDRAWIEDE